APGADAEEAEEEAPAALALVRFRDGHCLTVRLSKDNLVQSSARGWVPLDVAPILLRAAANANVRASGRTPARGAVATAPPPRLALDFSPRPGAPVRVRASAGGASSTSEAQLPALVQMPLRPVSTLPPLTAKQRDAGGAGGGKGSAARSRGPGSTGKARGQKRGAGAASAERAAKRSAYGDESPRSAGDGAQCTRPPTFVKRRVAPESAKELGGAAEEWAAAAAAEVEQRGSGKRGGGLSERQQLQAALSLSQIYS
ncbi:hypothetical protein T492DRAFT_887140, partial [Pavlovales sp. CCMP2436]